MSTQSDSPATRSAIAAAELIRHNLPRAERGVWTAIVAAEIRNALVPVDALIELMEETDDVDDEKSLGHEPYRDAHAAVERLEKLADALGPVKGG